ncbi:MAG: cas1 protein, partial [Actinobacteria bacterium]
RGLPVVFVSSVGSYRGRLVGATTGDVFLRREQMRRLDDEPFRLLFATRVVAAKIGNGRGLLQRHLRNHPELDLAAAVDALDASQQRALDAESLDALMGIEGDAAKTYFAGLGSTVRNEGFPFTSRSRRPPMDAFNAMLSLGYGLLLSEIIAALHAVGLDPQMGLLHDLDYGRPSLALDLIEEFRHHLIDRMVLTLVNRGTTKSSWFEPGPKGGIYLSDTGRPQFLGAYDALMTGKLYPKDAAGVDPRSMLSQQAKALRESIRTGSPYEPAQFEG